MTYFGPDVSRYQASVQLTAADWLRTDFLIARATHRGDTVDVAWEQFRRGARDHDVPFAAYCFVRPLSMMPVKTQVDAIKRAMGDEPVPLWFDHESDGSVPALSDHDLLVLGGAVEAAGFDVPTVYTGFHSDDDPFTPVDLAYLGYDGIVNARYPRQSSTTPPRGEPRAWYDSIGGDAGVGWDYNPGPATSPLRVLIWQFTSACRWGTLDRVDWNAIKDPAVLDRLFHDWTPTPQPPKEIDVLDYRTEIDAIWTAPPSWNVTTGTLLPDGTDPDRWLAVVVFKCGTIVDVQRRAGLNPSGRYTPATEAAYNSELAAQRATKV